MTGAPSGDTAAVIDLAAALDRVMGDRAMFLRLLARFAGDYRDLIARLQTAIDADDAVLAQRIAHTLKGAAGMIEALPLRRLALETELALKTDGVAPIALIDALDCALARVLVEVDALLVAQDAPALSAVSSTAASLASPALPVDARDLEQLRAMLDIGDGRAPELVALLRPRLLVTLGTERMAVLETAVRRFDFEHALLVLVHAGAAAAPDFNA
ncbi:HPt (histidine-containing phosphotransfer) domain-containing protein [Massilia sp. MP_M2]|uniref:Hpt domain-containing protein n=1 Tax=Massilia sp. MP_M2 TaxID=3071713 RepID=UPI00319EB5DE